MINAKRRRKEIEKSVGNAVKTMEMSKRPIYSAHQLMEVINDDNNLNIKTSEVRIALKYELNFSYRRAKEIPIQGNSIRCLIMR